MLEVVGDIPYMSPGEPRHKPRSLTSKGCPMCGRGHPRPAVPAVPSGPSGEPPGAESSSSSGSEVPPPP
eukprot:15461713-Alexandrium_andersonii.AAC.1